MKNWKSTAWVMGILAAALYAPLASNACELTIDSITTSNLTIQGTVSGNVGNLISGSTGVFITGGTNALLGTGASISVQNATDYQPGLLTAEDHVSFSAKLTPTEVTNAILTAMATTPEILLTNLTIYVATTGSDTNDGMSAGSPFQTIQHAVDVATTYWMPAPNVNLTIQLATGSYPGATLRHGEGSGNFIIIGSSVSPSSVIVTNGPGSIYALGAPESMIWTIAGVTIQNASWGIYSQKSATVYFQNVVFGSNLQIHLMAVDGGHIYGLSNYTVTGGGHCHLYADSGGVVSVAGRTITVSGTPYFDWHFAHAYIGGILLVNGCTFSGSATGYKYIAGMNGNIYIGGSAAGTNLFPGSLAGYTEYGGQYH